MCVGGRALGLLIHRVWVVPVESRRTNLHLEVSHSVITNVWQCHNDIYNLK